MDYKLYDRGDEITSPFGPRVLPDGTKDDHKGEDHASKLTDVVIAPITGVVVSSRIVTSKATKTWQWGNYVRVDSPDKYQHFFCHFAKRLVAKGDTIKIGQPIGIQGDTGYSFGVHCHYEIRTPKGKPINPKEYYKMKEEIKTADEAIKLFVERGLIDTPSHWIAATTVVKFLGELFIRFANYIK